MAFHCANATSVGLSIHFAGFHPPGTLFEAQLGLALPAPEFKPFVSSTVLAPLLRIDDLLPGTTYLVKTRTRAPVTHEWSDLSDTSIECRTLALKPGQPWVLPPRVPPTLESLVVSIAALTTAAAADELRVQLRPLGDEAWSTPVVIPPAKPQMRISGLDEGTTYEVRALAGAGVASDIVRHKTARRGVANLTVFRISELCGASGSYTYDEEYRRACQPDNLYNHDSGSLLADVEFINGAQGSGFVPDFNGSVTSRYCVSRVDRPYADYVSCNGRDTEHYTCTCNVFIDRCIGRLNTSTCHAPPPGARHAMPRCDCSAASTAGSARYIGRMPVYYPFPAIGHTSKHPTRCSPELVPSANESVYFGDWYSMPSAAECAPDATMLPGAAGCTWARRATHHFVHGFELLGAGFNLSKPYTVAQLRQNREVIERVLAQHQARCCDC